MLIEVGIALAVNAGVTTAGCLIAARLAAYRTRQEIVMPLVAAINAKDHVTHGHVKRVQTYATGLGEMLRLSRRQLSALRFGALLHDVGKLAVPDYVLNKPERLTRQEFEQMKQHTLAGAQILDGVKLDPIISQIAKFHHERWDGRGYPEGLKGDEIPVEARIISIVDTFDALIEDRQYRAAMRRDEAIAEIRAGIGSYYDPQVARLFLENLSALERSVKIARVESLPFIRQEMISEKARAAKPAAGLFGE